MVGQFEGGEDGVLAGESYQRRTGQGLVRIEPGHGEPETVLLAADPALLTVALHIVRLGQSCTSAVKGSYSLEKEAPSNSIDRR